MGAQEKGNQQAHCESVRFDSLQALEGIGITSKIHASSMVMEATGWDGECRSVCLCGGRVSG